MVNRDICKASTFQFFIFVLLFLLPWTVHAFTIKGSVQNVQESQNNFKTYIDVEIGTDFTGTLPNDIASIAITGPGGMVLSKADLSLSGRIFSKQIPGSPALGSYSFTVTSSPVTGSLTATAADEQTVNRSIPFADSTKFSPAAGTVVSTKTPTFSWQQVSYSEATVYYRIEVRDEATNTQLYLSPRRSNVSSFTIPANILQPGLGYKWRIRTGDSGDWIKVMNRSNSAWLTFTAAGTLQHALPPAIHPSNYGVVTYNSGSAVNYDVIVKITDFDGVALDGTSHTVTMRTPAGTSYAIGYSSTDNATTATYTKYIDLAAATPETGDFTFTVTDPDGHSATWVDTLTRNPLPIPDVNTYSPAAGAVLSDTTPTFTWAPVPGANDYQVRIYNADASQTIWTGSPGKQTSYTMPPGILSNNAAYRYRIYARDGYDPIDHDNISVAPNSPASSLPFSTGAQAAVSPYISVSNIQAAATYSAPGGIHPTRLDFYILVYDAQGVPGNIRNVWVKFPGGHEEMLYYDTDNTEKSAIRGYYTSSPDLPPEPGTYTFFAMDRDGHLSSATEVLTDNPIGYPAYASLRPATNTVIGGTAVDFSWDTVPGAACYQVRIYDIDQKSVLNRYVLENHYSLPAGFLKPGSLYRYDIRTYREFSADGPDNYSVPRWFGTDRPTFLTGSVTGGTSPPVIGLGSTSGVYTDKKMDPRTGTPVHGLNFYIKVTDPDGVPGNIASVRVIYPDGATTLNLRLGSVINATQAYYEANVWDPDPIQPGVYTFMVTDFDGNSVQITDTLAVAFLPCPVNLSLAGGAAVSGTTPTIRWDPVPGASYYKVIIYDGWDNQVYASSTFTMNAFTVPAGILQLNSTYSYTVYAYREAVSENLSNRSRSDYGTATERTHFTTTGQPPALFLNRWGVATSNFNADPNHYYDVSITVTDLDGIASTGASHKVTMRTPSGTTRNLSYSSSQSATTATYYAFINLNSSLHETGDFTFTATDPDGNTASIVDHLAVNLLPAPDASTFLPIANSVLVDTTPTISWAPVVGAQSYQARIYSADGSKTIWTGSTDFTSDKTSYRVPPGVLSPHTAYRYRISARDATYPFEIDNSSWAPNSSSSAPIFTTGTLAEIPFIDRREGVATYTSAGAVQQTRLYFYVHVYDAQGVPGNIRSIRVIFPNGHQEALNYDSTNSDNSLIRGVYTSYPDLPPQAGTYTFITEDRDGHVYSISEELNVNPIGYPSSASLRPQMNAVTDGTAVHFDWEDVPGAAYYILRIYDVNFNQVLSRSTAESGFDLPAGFLKPGSLYRYSINAFREFNDNGINNVSSTSWGNFDKPTFLTGAVIGRASTPTIDLRNSGVYIDHLVDPRTGTTFYNLNFSIRVSDSDGVPVNIASVRVTYPDGITTQELTLDSVVSSTQANYYERERFAENIQTGNYTFIVTDFDGNSVQTTDALVVDPLPCPVNLSPGEGALILGPAPTIRWDPVPGASDYEVRIHDGWDHEIYKSNRFTTNFFTVPAGTLQMNAAYSYTVFANREPDGQNLSNRSVSNYRSYAEMTHFTTADQHLLGDIDGNGFTELADALLSLQVSTGNLPTGATVYKAADVNHDGNIGLPEAVYIIQKVSKMR